MPRWKGWRVSPNSSLREARTSIKKVAVLETLLDQGADLHAVHGDHGNALFAASVSGYYSVVRKLLDHGAGPNTQAKTSWIYDGQRYPSILYAACGNKRKATVELLLEHGANLHSVYEGHGDALFVASHTGHERVVRALLERGAEINVPGFGTLDHKGAELANSLHAASYQGHTHIVQLLLDKSANVNSQDGHYSTALQAACVRGAKKAAMLLPDKGADINV